MRIFKSLLIAFSISSLSLAAAANPRGFFVYDMGRADSDFGSAFALDIGGGVQFNEHIGFEVAYNRYGDIGPLEIEIDSYSYGLNLGGNVSDNVNLYAIVGSEKLSADETISIGSLSIRIDESSNEAFYGIGANFAQDDQVNFRVRYISHDSNEFWTLTGGILVYF